MCPQSSGPSLDRAKRPHAPERILLANPRGFCAGVKRAIETVETALRRAGAPVFVFHEIVHNTHVVRELGNKGAVFVDRVEDVPRGNLIIFSAHGVSPKERAIAEHRGLKVVDATCPLVTKVHMEARRFAREGRTILLVGHEGHEEVVGTMGEAPENIRVLISARDVEKIHVKNPEMVAIITQTTLSLDETREVMEAIIGRFPNVVTPAKKDICYATTNRQTAVKEMAPFCDMILVIGSRNSSNSRRLAEVAESCHTKAHLIDDVKGIEPQWLEKVRTLGITAGASAPEHLVTELVEFFRDLGAASVEEWPSAEEEKVRFGLPSELRHL
ncbi:MAG: 4-hydroxy-3-methylbut-2-enyl diphosphate reductase [Thermodesulfobacteriota bacterium]